MLLTATCPEYQHNPGVGAPGFFPEFIIYMPSSFSFQAHYIPTGHFIQYGRPQEVYIPKKSKMVVYIAFSIQNSDIQIYWPLKFYDIVTRTKVQSIIRITENGIEL